MPDASTLLLFVGASLALLVIPGPAVLFLVTRSVDQGRGRAGSCPMFVDPARGHVVVQTLLLGTVFTLLAVLSDGACALLAGTLGGWLRSPARRRRLNRVSGTIYLGLGVTAALTGRPVKA